MEVKKEKKQKFTKSENPSKINGLQDIKKMEKLIDMLEENDDVQNVYHTWDMPDDEED